MKKFVLPVIEINVFDLNDILTASSGTPDASSAAPTTVPATTVPGVTDDGLDNEVSAKIWEF